MGLIARQEIESLGEQISASSRPVYHMRLHYGLSESELWRECTSAQDVTARVQQAAAQIVRLSVKDDWDHGNSWQLLENYLTGVLAAGAVPMVTFAKFGQPYDSTVAIRWFARSAGALVRRSLDRWGPKLIREWFWCLGDQPNSDWLNAGLTFDLYQDIYNAAAESVIECLGPHLEGQKARIGGPGIDGFQPFWTDWVYRFVNEIESRLIYFVVWHKYGDWRHPGEWGAPKDESSFRALLMSRSSEYEIRARAVNRMLKALGILNICGELNAHSDHDSDIGRALNQTEFGAAYYGSSLIHLLRGAADVEMLRSKSYGGTPQHFAKQLCSRFVRAGDDLVFPQLQQARGSVDVVVATSPESPLRAFLVHLRDEILSLSLEDAPLLKECGYVYKIDRTTTGKVVEADFDGVLRMEGYGVAVLTDQAGVAQ